jgi:hypothetical protein
MGLRSLTKRKAGGLMADVFSAVDLRKQREPAKEHFSLAIRAPAGMVHFLTCNVTYGSDVLRLPAAPPAVHERIVIIASTQMG